MNLNSSEIKNELFKGLKIFKEFCEKHNLRYFLAYGTLIGAARHQGFIPWDNDIDVIMPREDYNKLIYLKELIVKETFNECSLQVEYDNNFYPFSKFCLNKFPLKETNRLDQTFLYIDVFPIDYVCPKAEKKFKPLKMMMMFKGIKKLDLEGKTFSKKIKMCLIFILSKVLSKKLIKRKIYKNILKYKGNAPVNLMWGSSKEYKMASLDFNQFVLLKFCDDYFRCPINWEYYLETIYGSWQTLPPIEQRVEGHNYEFK